MLLPWCTEYFIPPRYVIDAKVTIGSLSDSQVERLRECFAAANLQIP
jgi:hypothetical protein